MSQHFRTLYSTGEFARMCHTTKETLFHYDALGILKPVVIKDNGYRFYSSSQYFEFDLIKVLQAASTSLKEIQDFMKHRNEEDFIYLLKEKKQQLEKEKEKIDMMQARINNAIEMTQYGVNTLHLKPFIQDFPNEHLIIYKLDQYPNDDHAIMQYVSQFLEYCRVNNIGEDLPLGSIIKNENIYKHCYQEGYYFTKTNKKQKDSHYLKKPKGTYAVILHEGYYNTIGKSIDSLLEFIDNNEYKIIGDCYMYEILSYFTKEDQDNYLIQISIQVDK